MKNLLKEGVGALATLLLAVLFVGCSGDERQYNTDVDIDAQIQGLKSSNKDERMNAAIELGMAGPNAGKAVPALIETLKDSDPEVRRLAAYALMEIGPEKAKEAIPAVKPLLQDPDLNVRMQAVNTLNFLDPNARIPMVNVQSAPGR